MISHKLRPRVTDRSIKRERETNGSPLKQISEWDE